MPERWRTGMAEQRGFDIRDADLAEQGKKRIEWARREMPVLRELAAIPRVSWPANAAIARIENL